MRFSVLLLLLACGPNAPDDGTAPTSECDPQSDVDGDGLDQCLEQELGLDPNLADSDGDGVSDDAELDCVSDPLDPDEQCYACGWAHNDPENLDGFGSEIGNTLADLSFYDQCGEQVRIHDFAGAYTILFMTAEWCGSCLEEAASLPERGTEATAEAGVDLGYVIVIWDDFMGEAPEPDVSVRYAEGIKVGQQIPVFADTTEAVLSHTPYDGEDLPGKCLLSPELELLHCWVGHDNDADAWQIASAHALAR